MSSFLPSSVHSFLSFILHNLFFVFISSFLSSLLHSFTHSIVHCFIHSSCYRSLVSSSFLPSFIFPLFISLFLDALPVHHSFRPLVLSILHSVHCVASPRSSFVPLSLPLMAGCRGCSAVSTIQLIINVNGLLLLSLGASPPHSLSPLIPSFFSVSSL